MKTKIVIPAVPMEVGELDLRLIIKRGKTVSVLSSDPGAKWYGYAINVRGGSIIFVPSIEVKELKAH